MQKKGNMTRIVKFLCIMVILFPIFLDASDFDRKLAFIFYLFSNFILYFVHVFWSHSSYNDIVFSFVISANVRCSKNDDCLKVTCLYPLRPICQFTKCKCIKSARGIFPLPTWLCLTLANSKKEYSMSSHLIIMYAP